MSENVKMFKIFKDKKGFNDITIVATILFIFLGTALVLPYVNTEFGTSGSTYSSENVGEELIEEEFADVTDVSAGDILRSVGKIFFWTFGDLPIWLDLIYTVLRLILLYILIRTFTPFIAGGG